MHIERDTFRVRKRAAPAHLPQPCDSRLNREEVVAPVAKLRQLLQRDHAGADETHLPTEHIEQLRQLVKARPTQDAADPCNTRIVRQLPIALPDLMELWIRLKH